MKVYPASSWRNQHYGADVRAMRAAGHQVYDFRSANGAFRWPACSTLTEYIAALEFDPHVAAAFERDKEAIDWADALVLILPCGKSAHLEAMYASGQDKLVIVKFEPDEPLQPELMYRLLGIGAGGVRYVTSTADLLATLRAHDHDTKQSAQFALELGQRDVARAIEILRTFTGVPLDAAIAAIEEAAGLNEEEPL
jgi:hypothetical protein